MSVSFASPPFLAVSQSAPCVLKARKLHVVEGARLAKPRRVQMLARWARNLAAKPSARAGVARLSYVANPMVQAQPLPEWATVDPYTAGITAEAGEGQNLLSGKWTSTRLTEEIVDPLTGKPMFYVPDTSRGEVRFDCSETALVASRSGFIFANRSDFDCCFF